MEHNTNQITLRGNLSAPPTFSHENHGKQFYRFFLEVPRLSGAADTLPVIAEVSLLESAGIDPGGMLTVTGQIRSHNVRTDGRRHLMIFVFASALTCEDGEALNDAELEGFLCREPIYRRTPLGREICDVMLAVPRASTGGCAPAATGGVWKPMPRSRRCWRVPASGTGSTSLTMRTTRKRKNFSIRKRCICRQA